MGEGREKEEETEERRRRFRETFTIMIRIERPVSDLSRTLGNNCLDTRLTFFYYPFYNHYV